MTNYEKIKNMSIDEMAKFLDELTERCCNNSCKDCPLCDGIYCCANEFEYWLNSEVKE